MLPCWKGDILTIRYRRWAVLRHPCTQETIWFNHGTFFNPYTLAPEIKEAVLSLGDEALSYNTFYGDGAPIEEETIKILDEAYSAETVSFPWQPGDVLMLDNMRIAHGRSPFKGKREVLVAMKRKIHCAELAADEQYSMPE
jgi:alpha-ketoglutarate-dependent taurine dioxygenase